MVQYTKNLILIFIFFGLLAGCTRAVGDDLPELFLLDVIAPPEYTISGTVNGLLGENLTLGNNEDSVAISASDIDSTTPDSFTFPQTLKTLDNYNIAILDHPRNRTQLCTINTLTRSGQVINSDIEDIQVDCVDAYIIKIDSATITGLLGTGLTLQNNGEDDLLINPGAIPAEFHTPVPPDDIYNVSIAANPTNPWQTCTFGGSTIANVAIATADGTVPPITCNTDTYDVIVDFNTTVNSNMVLSINGTPYAVPASAPGLNITDVIGQTYSGDSYDITIASQPDGQNCAIVGGQGTITNTNVYPSISCTTYGYLVGGTLTNLDGTGLAIALLDGSGNTLETVSPVTGDTTYSFSVSLPYGSSYSVEITNPNPTGNSQTCAFDSSGTIYTNTNIQANNTGVGITCIHKQFTITGNLTGLTSSGLTLDLYEDGTLIETISPSSISTKFTFSPGVKSGSSYMVRLVNHPTNQACRFADYNMSTSGTVADSNVTTQGIQCFCGSNLLVNGSGQDGVTGWTITDKGGDGWYWDDTGFRTSYNWDTKQQVIDLLAVGYTASVLDASPPITVWEHFYQGMNRTINGSGTYYGNYFMKVELLDTNKIPLVTYSAGNTTYPKTLGIYTSKPHSYTFLNIPPGVRYIRWTDGGYDGGGWGGYYGPRLFNATVIIGTPSCGIE